MFTIIIVIVCAFIFYLGYSFQKNRKSSYISKRYQEFRMDYEDAITAMGYACNDVLTKEVTLMIAVNHKGKILDAQIVEEQNMQMNVQTCKEYVGKNIWKYAQEEEKASNTSWMQKEPKTMKERAFAMAAKLVLDELKDNEE